MIPNTAETTRGYWLTAAACFLLMGLGMGSINLFGFYVAPLSEAFGISTAKINAGPGILMLTTAFTSAIVGRFLDRSYLRPFMCCGIVFSSLGLLGLSHAQSGWHLALCFSLYSLGMALYGPLVCNLLMVRRYERDRARALAIGAMGVSVVSVLLPQLAAVLLEQFDWRVSLQVIMAVFLVLLLIAVALIGKEPAPVAAVESEEQAGEGGKSLAVVPMFWITGLGFAFMFNMAVVMTIAIAPYFLDLGMSNTQAAVLVSAGGFFGLLGKLFFAVVSDRCAQHIRLLAVLLALVSGLGWVLIVTGDSFWTVFPGMMLVGFPGGISIAAYPYINSLMFDEKILGRVNGLQAPLMLPLGIAAPVLIGIAKDSSGSYISGFWGVVAMFVLVAVIFSRLPSAAPQAGDKIRLN